MEQLLIFCLGAAGYGILEILWRGYTHWTMLLVGGICFFVIYYMFDKFSKNSTIEKAILGALVITVIELFSGIIINLMFGWGVWDYSDVPFNILGQVCLGYSFLWFVISMGLVYLCKRVKGLIFYLERV